MYFSFAWLTQLLRTFSFPTPSTGAFIYSMSLWPILNLPHPPPNNVFTYSTSLWRSLKLHTTHPPFPTKPSHITLSYGLHKAYNFIQNVYMIVSPHNLELCHTLNAISSRNSLIIHILQQLFHITHWIFSTSSWWYIPTVTLTLSPWSFTHCVHHIVWVIFLSKPNYAVNNNSVLITKVLNFAQNGRYFFIFHHFSC